MPAISTLHKFWAPDGAERCGYITSRKTVECDNLHSDPVRGFRLSGKELIEKKAKATWHTHPGNTSVLSHDDYVGFSQWPDLTHHIVGQDGVRSYKIIDGLIQEVGFEAR